ncbi:hypothetical protein QQS21_007400 [Conoideocrella luteorostrata]|uniref:CBM20 domain-containing protein n=1 Tax=Conoideocrella luteorostrata TaxID=1105319 RepID=A0AAJ0CKU1_9HYPO|nr:hypothetical protein QQS21_007400 [Conoideocrella luteorostrata]
MKLALCSVLFAAGGVCQNGKDRAESIIAQLQQLYTLDWSNPPMTSYIDIISELTCAENSVVNGNIISYFVPGLNLIPKCGVTTFAARRRLVESKLTNVTVYAKRFREEASQLNMDEGNISISSTKSTTVQQRTSRGWNFGAHLAAGGLSISGEYSRQDEDTNTVEASNSRSWECRGFHDCVLETWTFYVKVKGLCESQPLIQCGDEKDDPCQPGWSAPCGQYQSFKDRNCGKDPQECEVHTMIMDENGKPFKRLVYYTERTERTEGTEKTGKNEKTEKTEKNEHPQERPVSASVHAVEFDPNSQSCKLSNGQYYAVVDGKVQYFTDGNWRPESGEEPKPEGLEEKCPELNMNHGSESDNEDKHMHEEQQPGAPVKAVEFDHESKSCKLDNGQYYTVLDGEGIYFTDENWYPELEKPKPQGLAEKCPQLITSSTNNEQPDHEQSSSRPVRAVEYDQDSESCKLDNGQYYMIVNGEGIYVDEEKWHQETDEPRPEDLDRKCPQLTNQRHDSSDGQGPAEAEASSSASAGDCTVVDRVAVTFNARAPTVPGESIKIVGDIDALGNWDPRQALALNASEYTPKHPHWTGTVVLDAGHEIGYKYIKVVNQDNPRTCRLAWQTDADNNYAVPRTCAATSAQSDSYVKFQRFVNCPQ